jgi:hypothetical protein
MLPLLFATSSNYLKVCALKPGGKLKSFRYTRVLNSHLLAQIADQSACYQPLVNFVKKGVLPDKMLCHNKQIDNRLPACI